MYEHHKQPLASRKTFYRRCTRNILYALFIMGFGLLLGTAGYHYTDGTDWLDALHNASMILSGMGPVIEIKTTAGKLFSAAYALFSGVLFITNVGLILAPAMHRLMHRLHLQQN